jgi:hypothetical protein
MKTTVVNRYKVGTDYDVYIGRPSKWGNPFTHMRKVAAKNQDLTLVANREEAVERYRNWLFDEHGKSHNLLDDLHELKGKRLGCWCDPEVCHGHVLAELADAELR